MKTLQNHFTTPEQSRRLLKLGVPAWTADLLQETDLGSIWKHRWFKREDESDYDAKAYQNFIDKHEKHTIPCWSVGRLIEIYELCYAQEFIRDIGAPLMEDVLSVIYDAVNDTTEQWDFSKLEE